VPTVWRERLRPGDLRPLFEELDASEIVIKPVVGANADGAFRLAAHSEAEQAPAVEAYYANRSFLAQPFVPAIASEGELSLFYFNGEYSHCVLKTPQRGDFRVQEEHGGTIRPMEADDALLRAGATALAAVGEELLYARADFVRAPGDVRFCLMELELIEPSMYLRMDDCAPVRFARALHERVQRQGPRAKGQGPRAKGQGLRAKG
jgi:glutathione synthase/RimK-type ligase-like ATP-grasp enzyme